MSQHQVPRSLIWGDIVKGEENYMDRLLAIIQTVTGFIGAASVVGAAVLGIYSSVSRKNKLSLTSRKPVWQWIIGCITILLVSTSIYYLAASQSPVNVHPPSTGTQRSNSTTTIATPTPSPKPTQPSYPRLATIYQGTITNITVNARSTLALTSIVQNQSQISGNVVLGPGWIGNGPFIGTIESNGSVRFTDNSTDGASIIIFRGSLHSDGSLGETYTIPSRNDEGSWETTSS